MITSTYHTRRGMPWASALLAALGMLLPLLVPGAAHASPPMVSVGVVSGGGAPPIVSAPTHDVAPHWALGAWRVPVRVRWSATDPDGVAGYDLQMSTDGRGYAWVVRATTATGVARRLAPDHNYRFRVRARDAAGNWGAWAYGARFTVAALQESNGGVAYGGAWASEGAPSAYGGSVRRTAASGALAKLTFTGSAVAWVATRSPESGRAQVYVDGVPVATVNLRSATPLARRVVFERSWPAPGPHTVEVRAVGDARIDVDAFAVLHSDPVVVGAGDIAACDRADDESTAQLLDAVAGTVLTLGDNVYPDGTAAQFADCYAPSWGRHRARTRPSPGNHDYHTPGGSGYYGYFGARAGDPSQGYYSYDLGAWHVVVINSNCSAVGGCGAGSPQEAWLRADLATHPSACTLAYWHHPRFSSGPHGGAAYMLPIWQALYDGGADVVLSGHDHDYERFAPQTPSGAADPARGIREFVVGTGGKSHYAVGAPVPNSEVRNGDTSGVLKLTLHPTGYSWEFLPEPGASFTDSGSSPCHP